MAKSTATAGPSVAQERKWKVESALETLTRAYDIIKDGALMKDVKKMAGERAKEMNDLAGKADRLARMGLISDKQREKIGKR